MILKILFFLIIIFLFASLSMSAVIRVPDDHSTIQAAVDSCVNGDTVLVGAGTYSGPGNRNINTDGKAITVMSHEGPLATFIDGEVIENGFNFDSGEDSTTIIEGFTIINVYRGVNCDSSGPVIRNIIVKNFLNHGIHFDGFSSDPPVTPLAENCLVFQEDPGLQGSGIGFFGGRAIDVTVIGCIFSYCTYGMEFHTTDNLPPNYSIEKCIMRYNVVDGIWPHT